MSGSETRAQRQLQCARDLFHYLAGRLNSPLSIRLWDGSVIALSEDHSSEYEIHLRSPAVLGRLIRKPGAETLLRLYASGMIDYSGGSIVSLIETARVRNSRRKMRGIPWKLLIRVVRNFLTERGADSSFENAFHGDETGLDRKKEDNRDYIQFHYDVGNEFYRLFLDPEMVYSCGYFRDWSETLAQAQLNKLEMICRKLQLKPGEKLLDIGCGWGALICYAAKNYGVHAHGITLSDEQKEFAEEKIRRLGLQDRVTVALCDYSDVEGQYDKISSIGMVEHVGIDNMSAYMHKVAGLLRDRGMFLNHGITRPAKKTRKAFRRMNAERRLLARYIFPGGELDHLGHMIECMESRGFDVHDVEGWRDHYSLTCRHWCERLEASRDAAIREIGEEKYRLWVLYLAGCVFALGDGGARIYQTVATRHAGRGLSGMPPTREHLYNTDSEMNRAA